MGREEQSPDNSSTRLPRTMLPGELHGRPAPPTAARVPQRTRSTCQSPPGPSTPPLAAGGTGHSGFLLQRHSGPQEAFFFFFKSRKHRDQQRARTCHVNYLLFFLLLV